ncbi:hypothetical protein [Streptomyces sp. NPDC020141]|uniref:hypothetical protein n=1 Tax=Streptomyces sp. NPDC020141 TaxID=3365065 RepID=UPI003799C67C
MLEIADYEDGPLVDGSGFLDLPLFWPCHLGSGLVGEEAQEAALGPDWDDAQDLCSRMFDAEEWPVFTVGLRSGHAVHVVYRNREGDRGVDYLLMHPSWQEAVTLAVDDGHFRGPGLCWPELASAADQAAPTGVTDPDARLLLLFPMLGDAGVPESAAARLASALAALTLAEDPARLARLLLRNQGQWESANWTRRDGEWICDGSHSFRDPSNAFALTPAQTAAVSSAFAAGPDR